ncbi:PAS domain S-box protein [Ectothiorhodospiraceae bacterium BW-2]|nr:PAS domain S-box protein [Ectothiorhodospiraceae bacterium BW-2]
MSSHQPELSSRRIYLLFGINVAGFLLLIGLDLFVTALTDELNRQLDNERSYVLIGELLSNDLSRLEARTFQLASTRGREGRQWVFKEIEQVLMLLDESLQVLREGGVIHRATRLTIESHAEMIRTFHYQPVDGRDHVLEAIDLTPKLIQIRHYLLELLQLLDQNEESEIGTGGGELQIRATLQLFPPLFTRMRDNSNRLFYESQRELNRIAQRIDTQEQLYRRAQLVVSLLIVVAVLTIGFRTLHQIQQANSSLRRMTRDLELQTFAMDQHAIVTITDDQGVITYANHNFCDINAVKADEIIGKRHEIVRSGEHPPSFYRHLWQTIRSGKVWRGEVCNRAINGRYYWLDGVIVPFLDDNGRPFQYVAIKTDITARKKMAQEILERERFLNSLTDAMGEGVYAQFSDGRCRFMNPEAERLLGWSEAELHRLGIHDTIHHQFDELGRMVPVSECNILRATAQGETFRSDDEMFRRRDGTLFPVSLVSVPLFHEGELSGSVTVFSDATIRKETERLLHEARESAERANRLKSDFLANMSHEIRTPMNAIIGLSQLTLETELDSRQRDYIDKVNTSANALLGILNDILDFSKIEAGKLDIEQIEFNLDDLLAQLYAQIAILAEKRNLRFILSRQPELPLVLFGDPMRISQILINLANNAVKFTEEGEVVVKVRGKRLDHDSVELRIAIRDSGIGISAEQQRRLFNSFSQADSSTTRKYGGTGLGLTISKKLVEMMGGEIGLHSVVGEGTTFHITLPCRSAERSPNPPLPLYQGEGQLVALWVSDSELRDELNRQLCHLGMQVEIVTEQAAWVAKPYPLWCLDSLSSEQLNAETLATWQRLPGKRLLLTHRTEPQQWQQSFAVEATCGLLLTPTALRKALQPLFVADEPSEPPQRHSGFELLPLADRRVLLVEDNHINQLVATEQLKKMGVIELQLANNGQEAVERLKEQRFDLVLMDIQMPIMDGYEATRIIRQLLKLTDLPIVAMTANAMTQDFKLTAAAGMNDHITKPLDSGHLYAVLKRYLLD